jgi:hypothetical protein
MPQTFETFIQQERERLSKAKEVALAKKQEAEDELSALEIDFAAVAAYESAKKGKPAKADEKKQRAPRQTGKRNEVLKLVEQYPQGVTAGELKDKLGIRGDKQGEQSLSNALSALKKSGQLIQEDGKYKAAAA